MFRVTGVTFRYFRSWIRANEREFGRAVFLDGRQRRPIRELYVGASARDEVYAWDCNVRLSNAGVDRHGLVRVCDVIARDYYLLFAYDRLFGVVGVEGEFTVGYGGAVA